MTVPRCPSGGRAPLSEALREGDSTAAGPRASGDFIATDARGPLRRAFDRLVVVTFSVAIVVVGALAGVAIAVVALAVFVGWATLSLIWALRLPIVGLALAVLIAEGAGWV